MCDVTVLDAPVRDAPVRRWRRVSAKQRPRTTYDAFTGFFSLKNPPNGKAVCRVTAGAEVVGFDSACCADIMQVFGLETHPQSERPTC